MTKALLFAVCLCLSLHAGVIEGSTECSDPKVVKELLSILKSETNTDPEYVKTSPGKNSCQAQIHLDNKDFMAAYYVLPFEKSTAGLDRAIIEKFRKLKKDTSKQFVRVEFVSVLE
ncbi:hypothetical protein E0765_07485 [Sulfuricurvum sp. IAE1]|uniref:hypothetical protein n=1 Tax=Sulfuricurvum sp. IAE1 TaxID=2546102 RepID=UPI0010444673|nr:hypothetical protein [Sulfuricurvum sp. IAE1]TDA63669.1 hypothetical protein E0765_07485 [Sulfuricurvum sp. IAE1]